MVSRLEHVNEWRRKYVLPSFEGLQINQLQGRNIDPDISASDGIAHININGSNCSRYSSACVTILGRPKSNVLHESFAHSNLPRHLSTAVTLLLRQPPSDEPCTTPNSAMALENNPQMMSRNKGWSGSRYHFGGNAGLNAAGEQSSPGSASLEQQIQTSSTS